MVATSSTWHTPASVRLLPDDGNRYECIAGELLVTPAPRNAHQSVLMEFIVALLGARDVPGLRMLTSPADIELREDALTQPDLFFYVMPLGVHFASWADIKSLELAIEVLSPSTARYDRVTKRKFYQEVGVPEYWVVDADARVVERWRPSDDRPEICATTLAWTPAGAATPIEVDLSELFERALGSTA